MIPVKVNAIVMNSDFRFAAIRDSDGSCKLISGDNPKGEGWTQTGIRIAREKGMEFDLPQSFQDSSHQQHYVYGSLASNCQPQGVEWVSANEIRKVVRQVPEQLQEILETAETFSGVNIDIAKPFPRG